MIVPDTTISSISSSSSNSCNVSLSLLLSKLNAPPLVGMFGFVLALFVQPYLEQQTLSVWSLISIKVMNMIAYGVNLYATSQPGRLDGIQQQLVDEMEQSSQVVSKQQQQQQNHQQQPKQKQKQQQNEQIQTNRNMKNSIGMDSQSNRKMIQEFVTKRNRSLFNPSGWAFTIWAPIFLGELIFTISSALLVSSENVSATALLRKISPGFVMSQIFQSLWAASFRPKYFSNLLDSTKKGSFAPSWVSAIMLSRIALSLNRAHLAYTSTPHSSSSNPVQYVLFLLPLSLHFGWTTAAALVNVNGNIAGWLPSSSGASPSNDGRRLLAWLGHASALAATVLGVTVTIGRNAPVYGGVIAWALLACATGLTDRIHEQDHRNGPSATKGSKSRPKNADTTPVSAISWTNRQQITFQEWVSTSPLWNRRKATSQTTTAPAETVVSSSHDEWNNYQGTGYHGARVQQWLCRLGSFVTATTSVAIALLCFVGTSDSTTNRKIEF